jgi:hypothetical protein
MKKQKSKVINGKLEFLLEDETHTLRRSKGNGILKRQIWCDDKGKVTRYSLAYINHNLHPRDNGRVLGFDNSHGYHHRHKMGKVDAVNFKSFAEIEERFKREFEVIHASLKKK